ncbi:hypothetical protein ABPG75_000184 [Micractinium tetrahymenae]
MEPAPASATSSEGETSSSSPGANPLFAGWNIARWALGSGGGVRPPAVVVPSRPPPAPQPVAAASAAAQAAASLAAWEEAEERPAARGFGSFGALGPAASQEQQQQLYGSGGLGGAAGGAAYLEEEEQEFYEEEEEEAEWDTYRPFKLLLAGGVAGAVSRTATAPMDRLKMLLQIQDCQRGLTIKEGIRKMAAEGTVHAFFKGNGTNVVKIAPETAIKLTLNDALKHVVAADPDEITPAQRMTAGALAGACAQATIYPFELVRTRLAVCTTNTYGGIVDCAQKVLAQEGWRAFYRGMVPSMLGILPYAGVDITIFELLKERLLDEYEGASPPAHLILAAGMLSSSIAQFAAYPLALTRTRLQAQGIGGKPIKYRGMMDVLRKTVANEGVRGLYKGSLTNLAEVAKTHSNLNAYPNGANLLPVIVPLQGSLTNLAKVAPAAGISWLVFEQAKLLMSVDHRR